MKKSVIIKGVISAFFIFGMGMTNASAQGPGTPPPGGMPIGGPGPVMNGPGFGNGPAPAPGSQVYNPGPPPPAGPPPMANIVGSFAPVVVNAPLSSPNWQNAGTTTVIACGYDAQGVWRTIPLRVSYNYNGAQYDVTVDSAWNPWTDSWNYGVDVPAFNTNYFLNGTTFDFYTNLSTGTWYFNL